MKKIWLSLFLTVFLSSTGTGQTLKAYLEAAEEAMEQGNYYAALTYFDEALQFDTNRIDLLYKSAEAARNFNAYSTAAEKYKKVIEREKNAEYPLASFWRAIMLQRLGDYEASAASYDLYLSEHEGEDEYYTMRAKKEKEAVDWAVIGAPSPFREVNLEHLDQTINTPYSEFGAIATEDILYYSSLRYTKEDDDRYPKRLISKILKKDEDDPEGIPVEGNLNVEGLHSAHTTFSLDGTRIYYTICDYKTDDSIVCQLYFRRIDDEGMLGDAIKLPDSINIEGYTATQPHISYEPNLKKEILYYVSDKPGGAGKKDIYYSIIDASGNFSLPMNLEAVNTPEDEMSPFFHKESKKLYFSSEGYNGYGGLDVFCVKQSEGGWGKVVNIGEPINSSFHDVYFVIEGDEETAYFSSNRIGSYYLDDQQKACCFDIYKANIKPCDLNLKLLVYDALNNEPLLNSNVMLYNLSDEEKMILSADSNGNEFITELDCNKEYKILVDHANYYKDSIVFNTSDIGDIDTLVKKIFLFPSHVDLKVLTFKKKDLDTITGVTVTIKDLMDNSKPDLVLTNPTGNEFYFKVEKGKPYRITAEKPYYATVSVDFATPEDRLNNDTIVKKLFLDLFGPQRLAGYIYFDNDHPNPKSWRRTTDNFYTDTYRSYYSKKDTFIAKYADTLQGAQRQLAVDAVENFFEFKLKEEYEKYLQLLEELYQYLIRGAEYQLTVTGYASPRASSAYNRNLSARRYDAVKKEIEGFREGALWEFRRNGQLKIKYIPAGEDQAPKDVSDAINDERNSIYSPKASMERRVEILEVKKINN